MRDIKRQWETLRNIGVFDTMIDGLSTYRKYSSPSILTMTTDGQMDGERTYLIIEMLLHLKMIQHYLIFIDRNIDVFFLYKNSDE